jgi:ABC-2 type transport system ATP-binding protein
VYLNGALLGFSKKEMDELYDEVVAFSELEEFMDRKLKNYSSGMQVRLAFSIAIHADSEILLLDEILAVGDEAFQAKCNDYFLQLKEEGKTVILVTHDMGSVKKYCNKAVLIDDGEVKVIGSPDDVANQYSLDNFARVISDKAEEAEEVEKIVEVDQLTVKMNSPEIITESDTIDFDISYQVLSEIESYIAFSITDVASNAWIYNDNSFDLMTEGKGKKSFNYQVKLPMLNSRKLKLQVSVRNGKNEMVAFASSENTPMIIIERTDVKTISEKDSATGVINRNGNWRVGL